MKIDYTKLLEKISAKGKYNVFVAIGVVGILLIMFSDFNFSPDAAEKKTEISLKEYRQELEKEITGLLMEIDGVGDVKVMVTLETGLENIYVQQQRTTSDTQTNQENEAVKQSEQSTFENEVVIVSGQNGDEPLIEKIIQPAVQGVAVVCSGADDITVVSAVTNSVAVVLNIPTNRICVTKMR